MGGLGSSNVTSLARSSDKGSIPDIFKTNPEQKKTEKNERLIGILLSRPSYMSAEELEQASIEGRKLGISYDITSPALKDATNRKVKESAIAKQEDFKIDSNGEVLHLSEVSKEEKDSGNDDLYQSVQEYVESTSDNSDNLSFNFNDNGLSDFFNSLQNQSYDNTGTTQSTRQKASTLDVKC